MRLLIKPLIPRLKSASRLHSGPGRWIFDVLEVNDPPRRMTRTPGTTKRISLPRILLLIHHQVGPNSLWHSPKKNRTVVFIKEDPNNKTKARILLPLESTPLLSGNTKTSIRTKMTSPTLSATLVSRRAIMPTSALKKSQKTSICLNNFYVIDWG